MDVHNQSNNILRVMTGLDTAPIRNTILKMPPENQHRRQVIIQRANWLVQHMRNPQIFRDSLEPAQLELLHSMKLNYDFLTNPNVGQVFLTHQRGWELSNDCADLRQTMQGLMQTNRLARINKIVCFGLGPLADDELLCPYATSIQKYAATACTQHAAALTIAAVLETQRPQEKIKIYAQEPRYRQQDIAVLKYLGIEVLNHEYGVHQGLTTVDENTFVLSTNTTNFLQQIICETNRPAAMIWSSPDPNDGQDVQAAPETQNVLEAEYEEHECSALKDAWDPGYESEIATTKVAPEFGQCSPCMEELQYSYRTCNSNTRKAIMEMVCRREGLDLQLRKFRHLAETSLFVRRDRLDFHS